jgi:hypothetical protein
LNKRKTQKLKCGHFSNLLNSTKDLFKQSMKHIKKLYIKLIKCCNTVHSLSHFQRCWFTDLKMHITYVLNITCAWSFCGFSRSPFLFLILTSCVLISTYFDINKVFAQGVKSRSSWLLCKYSPTWVSPPALVCALFLRLGLTNFVQAVVQLLILLPQPSQLAGNADIHHHTWLDITTFNCSSILCKRF